MVRGGFLRYEDDAKAVLLTEFAIVEGEGAGEDAEEGGLAGAVSSYEADALALLQRERGAVEEGQVAVGELGVLDGEEGQILILDQVPTANGYSRELAAFFAPASAVRVPAGLGPRAGRPRRSRA